MSLFPYGYPVVEKTMSCFGTLVKTPRAVWVHPCICMVCLCKPWCFSRSGMVSRWCLCYQSTLLPLWQLLVIDHGTLSQKFRHGLRLLSNKALQAATASRLELTFEMNYFWHRWLKLSEEVKLFAPDSTTGECRGRIWNQVFLCDTKACAILSTPPDCLAGII